MDDLFLFAFPSSCIIDTVKTMTEVTNIFQDPALIGQTQESNVTVIVAGSRFCIIPSLWKNVHSLPWLNDDEGFPHLMVPNANPDVFEMLLQYFLFGTLPSDVSKENSKELKELASSLPDVEILLAHLKSSNRTNPKKAAKSLAVNTKNTTSAILKKMPSLKNVRKQVSARKLKSSTDPEGNQFSAAGDDERNDLPTIDIDYVPNLEATESTDSDDSNNYSNTSGASEPANHSNQKNNQKTKIPLLKAGRRRSSSSSLSRLGGSMKSMGGSMKSVGGSVRSMSDGMKSMGGSVRSMSDSMKNMGGSMKDVLTQRKSSHSGERKMTHEEWCASDYVL